MVDPAPNLLRFTAPSFTPEAEAERAIEALATAGAVGPVGTRSIGADTAPSAEGVAPEPAVSTEPPTPPGARLLGELAEGLRAEGWQVDYQWATYRGHALDARRLKRRYDVEVWLCEPEAARWELSAEPRRGLFRRLFRKAPDPVEQALLRLHLEAALRHLADVRDVTPWQGGSGEPPEV